METRNILDINGNIIGVLSFPEGTPEEIWAQKLSEYLIVIPEPEHEIPDVTPRQIRQALFIEGVTEQMIDDALATLPEPDKTLATIEWKCSTAFQRNRPLVSAVGAMLEWTDEELDELWIFAGTL